MEEAKIPVFSVLKKGTTLKNIFLNSPPPETGKPLSPSRDNDSILMGRHPDCHIIVDHPSISRFHLEVRSKSSLQKLFVTDRSSVHGTWVSGKKIQPNTPVELVEGDTIRLGASTRIYRLHWMPLSYAFELDKPMSPLIEEASDFVDNDVVLQDEDFNETWASNIIPSAPPMRISSPGKLISQDLEKGGELVIKEEMFKQSVCFSSMVPSLESVSSSFPLKDENGDSRNFLANAMQPEREDTNTLRSDKITKSSSLLLRRNKSISFLQIDKISKDIGSEISKGKEDLEVEEKISGAFAGGNGEEKIPFVLLAVDKVKEEEEESLVSDKENMTPVNSFGSNVLKSNKKIERFPLSSFSIFHKDDLEIEEQKAGDLIKKNGVEIPSVFLAEGDIRSEISKGKEDFEIEEQISGAFAAGNGVEKKPFVLLAEDNVKEEEEGSFVSDEDNMTPVNSIGSKVLKSNKKIERFPLSSFSIFHKEDLEIEEEKAENLIKKNGLEIPSVFLPEGDEEVEKEIFASYEKKMTLVNSIGSYVLKSNGETNKSLLKSVNISNRDDLKIEEKKVGTFTIESGLKKNPAVFLGEVHLKEEEGGTFTSDKENMTLINSIGSNLLRSISGIETSPLSTLSTFNLEERPSNSDKTLSDATEQFKSNKIRSRSRLMKENGDSKFSNSKTLESLFTPGVKLQRSLFTAERSPLSEKALNVEEDRLLSDKEHWTPKAHKCLKSGKSFARDLLRDENEGDETFASDKENLTPQSSMHIKSKKALLQRHGKEEGETMSRKERVPFQPLFVSSPLRNSSPASYVEGLDETFGNNCVSNAHNLDEKAPHSKHNEELPRMPGRETKKWYIVVDVGCFLTEESRKSLQLLEGIRGTQLIIPRIVIRELDHLKRCQGILSRGTKASSVLQWIEESMMKTSWWIHVQNSSETFPAAPTPPATPRSQLCDGSSGFGTATSSYFTGFSTCGSLMEIVSPTAEDHILDCALLFKRIKDDGQLMLLTSSTTLRIKAMAEGLLCETPKEFRESLVNPFSKRFLWADSSPRGSTWSCLEEVGLPENCYQQFAPARIPKAEGTAKGLKLLLHSSHCGIAIS